MLLRLNKTLALPAVVPLKKYVFRIPTIIHLVRDRWKTEATKSRKLKATGD